MTVQRLALLGAGLAAGLALAWSVSGSPSFWGGGSMAGAQAVRSSDDVRQVPQSQAQIQLSFAPVVRQVTPSVVNIYAKKVVRRPVMMEDPFFQFFFRGQGGPSRERVESSLGSGVIVRNDGIIVTNRHVVGGADEITVVMSDKREFEGKVILQDPRSDLALVKINASGAFLPAIKLGDSDRLQVGDIALAIGNPFGVGQTVTQGIVSAVRSAGGPTDYQYYIQTDAAINPGNSGGALVGVTGELLGINTFIASPSGGSVGVGFAVPVNLVRSIIAGAATGKVIRPWIGLKGQAIDADLAASLKLDRPVGVLVNQLNQGSPAARAGLKSGDVITAVDGREVADTETLLFRLATKTVGSNANLTVVRNGKPQTVAVSLIAPPEIPARSLTWLKGDNLFSGIKIGNLSPAFAQELGTGFPDSGVVVTELMNGSAVARFGLLQPGDVIDSINGKPINSVSQLEAIAPATRSGASFRFLRSGRAVECSVQPPAIVSCRQ